MRLLVTRPAEEAARTAARLSALGHVAVLAPMLRYEPLPLPATTSRPAALALTSARAVEAIGGPDALPGTAGVPLFCVGETTAAAARAAGFADIRVGAGGATALARGIAAAISPDRGPILYAAARERTGDLEAELARLGYVVDIVEVYRMAAETALPPEVAAAIGGGMLDGVLAYSRRTTQALVACAETAGLGAALRRVPLFALSAAIAAGLGFERVSVAAAPDESALLAMLEGEGGTSAAGMD